MEKALFGGVVPTVWLQEQLYTYGKWGLLESGALLAAFYLALLVFLVLPTVPPWMAAERGELPGIFPLVVIGAKDLSSEGYYAAHHIAGTNAVAAMPSLHMATSVVVALAAQRARPLVAGAGIVYAALMGFALVYTGEHYAVDILMGALLGVAAWKLAAGRGRRAAATHEARTRGGGVWAACGRGTGAAARAVTRLLGAGP